MEGCDGRAENAARRAKQIVLYSVERVALWADPRPRTWLESGREAAVSTLVPGLKHAPWTPRV